MYYPLVRKALFQLDPERAHEAIFQQLRRITGAPLRMLIRQRVPARPVAYMGLTFRNPLGLAAGLDKNGECIDALGAMGFGSAKVDTITPRPQSGSGKPRTFCLVDVEGLINRMGLNNRGVDNLAENVRKTYFDSVLDINIGKNKDTSVEHGKDGYLICMEEAYPHTGYIAIDISLPNTPGLCMLQYGEAFNDLLSGIKNKQLELQQKHQEHVPVAVRIVPDLLPEELIQAADNPMRHNIDEVIVANTTLDHSLVQGMRHYDGTDGPGGRPLQLKSIEIIRMLSAELNGRLSITGVGGIDSATAARGKITAGASLVQICSGFIFKGLPLAKGTVARI